MRELTSVELQAVSGGLATLRRPNPIAAEIRKIEIAVLERIVRILEGGAMRKQPVPMAL
jgi:hypothetical protein